MSSLPRPHHARRRPEVVNGFDLPTGGEPFGGYSYLAGLYVSAPGDLNSLAGELHGALIPLSPRVLASASAPSSGLCVARVLARDATALIGCSTPVGPR